MDEEMCQILAYCNAKAYGNTKRLSKDRFTFDQELWDTDGKISEASKWLNARGIISKKPFVGLHGADKVMELDYPGFVAYRVREKSDGCKHVEIFVTCRGSQGEGFQELGGLGGASWLTNLDAAKIDLDGASLRISNKYFISGGDQRLSLHQGYARKFMSFKADLSGHLNELLKNELNQVSYDVLSKNFSDKDKNLTGNQLKTRINAERKCSFQVYCTGHSQGGGVAQIVIAFLTTFIGEYLYGPNFDNKELNLVYGVFISPARAWGNERTRSIYENVVGINNMIGCSTVMDIVTCLPLGHNIEKDKAKVIIFEIGKLIVNRIAKVFGNTYIDLAKLIFNSEHSYETLTHWAFEDPVDILLKYCTLNVKAIDAFIKDVKAGKIVVEDEAKYVKSLLEEKSKFENFTNNSKNVSQLNELIKEAQEEYFYAHRQNVLFAKTRMHYHALMATNSLIKAVKMSGGPATFIASQHFGAYNQNSYLDKNGQIKVNLGAYFSPDILSFDLQQCAERADAYYEKKNRMVK
ncbi:MAG: hypothetical protein LBF43_01710 [Puniceicoccales bacterium]|nr:hypothetical protein [Puniceicoccales bacterium]